MGRRITFGLILVVVAALSYVGYARWKQNRAMLSGDVSSMPSDNPEAEMPATPAKADKPVSKTTDTPGAKPSGATEGLSSLADTLSPNPPNGKIFAGAGHYQVYRQGNLTYRINTDTGQTCVLFATDEEWRKPRVYQNGCGSAVR